MGFDALLTLVSEMWRVRGILNGDFQPLFYATTRYKESMELLFQTESMIT